MGTARVEFVCSICFIFLVRLSKTLLHNCFWRVRFRHIFFKTFCGVFLYLLVSPQVNTSIFTHCGALKLIGLKTDLWNNIVPGVHSLPLTVTLT